MGVVVVWKRVGLVCVAASLATLTACNSGTASGGSSGGSGGGSGVAIGAGAGESSRAGSIDVCRLLSAQDAGDVARAQGLGGDSAAQATYKLTTTKAPGGRGSACTFHISAVVDGQEVSNGTVQIQVVPGSDFDIYRSQGQPVAGLGDEAAKVTGTTMVKVGDLMLQAGEDSFSDDFVVGLYRKMIPKLR